MRSYTLEEIAKIESVNPETAQGWVRSGELVAYSVSASRSSKKRRWRVTEESLNQFRLSRQSGHAEPTATRRRKPASIKQYV